MLNFFAETFDVWDDSQAEVSRMTGIPSPHLTDMKKSLRRCTPEYEQGSVVILPASYPTEADAAVTAHAPFLKTQALLASGSASSWTTNSYAQSARMTNKSNARSSRMRRELPEMLNPNPNAT